MSRPESFAVLLDLAVGQRHGTSPDPGPALLPTIDAAREVAAAARDAGATAVHLPDARPGATTLDPTVVASYLAGRVPGIGYVVETPTTHQAPYNLARRVLALDRATDGRAGLLLRPGRGDAVTDTALDEAEDRIEDAASALTTSAFPAVGSLRDTARRWHEYAEVVTRLWESVPIEYEGRFYRVAGALDEPASGQGRPVLLASDADALGWAGVAAHADVVLVEAHQFADASAQLTRALNRIGRRRTDVALLARVRVGHGDPPGTGSLAQRLFAVVTTHGLDGVSLVPVGGVEVAAWAAQELIPRLHPRRANTLRAALGLPYPVEVVA